MISTSKTTTTTNRTAGTMQDAKKSANLASNTCIGDKNVNCDGCNVENDNTKDDQPLQKTNNDINIVNYDWKGEFDHADYAKPHHNVKHC